MNRRLLMANNKLTVGSTIQLYTNYETISGTKVKVVAMLAYSEIERQTYNITALAINERVISVADEDLEQIITNSGDSVYLCRATDRNADGGYSEYVVWDSIINAEKTKMISSNYEYTLNIKLLDTTNVPVTQIISGIEKYIKNNYPTSIDFSIEEKAMTSNTYDVTKNKGISDEQLSKVEAIISKLANFETRLIPASEKIVSLNMSEKLDDVANKIDTINKNITIISQAI